MPIYLGIIELGKGSMNMRVHPILYASGLLLLSACSGPSAEECSDEPGSLSCKQQRSQALRSTQGRSTQGRSTQGRSTQGTGAASTTVEQISLNGVVLTDLTLQGTLLSGSRNGQPVQGAALVGATILQRDIDGTAVVSTLTQVTVDPQDPRGETLLYSLTTTDPDTGSTTSFCLSDPYGGSYAIPLAGAWDDRGTYGASNQITLACTAGVAAKCVRWGYKPWKTVNGQSLAPYHQACLRMARADYCGDGVSHTADGTLIDMYDSAGIQVRTPFDASSPLYFDAAWTPHGAWCVTKDRWLKLSSLASVSRTFFVQTRIGFFQSDG